MPHNMIAGLGTVIYRVTHLDRAKAWYSAAFQQTPYFDQPFYVGFNVGGYELGLDPDPSGGRTGRVQRCGAGAHRPHSQMHVSKAREDD